MKYTINQMYNLLSLLNTPFSHATILVTLLFLVFISVKIILLYFIISAYYKRKKRNDLLLLAAIPLFTYIIGEITFIIFLFSTNAIAKMLFRIAWHMQPIHFFAHSLFLNGMIKQQYCIQPKNKLLLKLLSGFILSPLLLCIKIPTNNYWLLNFSMEIFCWVSLLKILIIKFSGILFLIANMMLALKKVLEPSSTPSILRLQIMHFLTLSLMSVIPEIILLCASTLPSFHTLNNNIVLNLLSSALFTASLLFFARRIYHLRFLNLTEQVVAGPTSRLTSEQLLETKHALCTARDLFALSDVHAAFFDQLAHIAPERIIFYVRKPTTDHHAIDAIGQTIEQFLQNQPELASHYFVEDSLLVYDELAFTNFYEQSNDITTVLSFMNQLDATVFIPLKQNEKFFGVIIITKDTNKDMLFSQSLQTQMQLYGTFVTCALDRFEHEDHRTLIEEHKKLSLKFFKTHEKNARFHESFASLLKPDTLKRDGVILYKNRLFRLINPTTQELLQINPNLHQGHPLSKALKEVAQRVTQYSTSHTIIEKNISGQAICCQGFPYQKDELIILVSVANITDTLTLEHALLSPADTDYTIFLHSTEVGQTVNQAIPGDGTTLHTAKVHLLKILLSKKVMILDVHDNDIDMMLAIAQKVCRKTNLHTIDAAKTGDHDTIATLLCGKQRFTSTEIISEHGLLYTLDEFGIIHIANAHKLPIPTQKLLLQFFKTGSFCLYRSEMRHTSNATIIFSSNDDLALLCKQGALLKELYDYLQDAIITLPNLGTLPFAELDLLARSYQKQFIVAAEYYHLFGFSTQEQERLDANRPTSYHELQKMISASIKQRMNQSALASETTLYTPKSQPHDTMLLEAARLGKQALKNRKLMRALWEKFKNQSKIAQLLDVDKSSVHRRFKQYGIGQE